MLVLNRERNQTVIIGEGADAVVVTVCRHSRQGVKLGIVAPKHVPVHRGEVYKKIHGGDGAEEA